MPTDDATKQDRQNRYNAAVLEMLIGTHLDINDPNFETKFRDALGVKNGEPIEFRTRQFERTDGILPRIPKTTWDWTKFPKLDRDFIKRLGCCPWELITKEELASGSSFEHDGERIDEEYIGYELWLFPFEWYEHITEGTEVVTINYFKVPFSKEKMMAEKLFGLLPFGFLRKPKDGEKLPEQ